MLKQIAKATMEEGREEDHVKMERRGGRAFEYNWNKKGRRQ